MAVYDKENQEDLEPNQLRERENEAADPDSAIDGAENEGEGNPENSEEKAEKTSQVPWKKFDQEAAKEERDIKARLGTIGKDIREEDKGEGGGFFRDDGGIKSKAKSGLGGLLSSRKKMLGLGGGLLGFILGSFALFNFLGVFRLEHMLSNVDSHAFSRFNAAFDNRSDAWMRAYFRMRLAEIDGNVDSENPYFRARRVDTDHPIRDWYRTLRTSQFEADLAKKGIIFESRGISEGGNNFQLVVLKVEGENPFQAINASDVRAGNIEELLNGGDYEARLTELFEPGDRNNVRWNQIKSVINDEVPWYRVVQRRHLRRDIANQNGVQEWRFFDKTRTRIENKKIAVQRKIIQRVFSDNSNSQKFLLCLLDGTSCPRNSDPSNPDSKANVAGAIDGDSLGDSDTPIDDGSDSLTSSGNDIVDGINEATEEVLEEPAEELSQQAADELTEFGPIQKIILRYGSRLASSANIAGSIWGTAKTISAIHNAFGSENGNDSTLVSLVKSARSSQASAVYTTYSIARDQVRSGELTSDELGALYSTTQDFEKSEGWDLVAGNETTSVSLLPSVNAEATTDSMSRNEYCDPSNSRALGQYAYLCDDERPSSGGRVETMADTYNSTMGTIFAPIAAGVDGVTSIPGLDWVLNKVESISASVSSAAVSAFGLEDNIQNAMAWGITQLVNFAGTGPSFDGTKSGAFNKMLVGGIVTAEGSTRGSGGARSNETTLRYSNQLAVNYERSRVENMSLFQRYASPSNPDSVVAKALSDVSNSSGSETVASLGSSLTNFSWLGSLFSHKAQADIPASSYADWAGVDKYDIPQQCMELDPLGETINDIYAGTNFDETAARFGDSITLNWDTARDTDAFYQELYDWVGDDTDDKAAAAKDVYNCHLFDARLMGGIGFLYGYTGDHGYETTSDTPDETNNGNTKIYLLGDSLSEGMAGEGDLETKLTDAGWRDITIHAKCGRHLAVNGQACGGGNTDPDYPGGLAQVDSSEGQAAIAGAGAVVVGLGTNDPGSATFENDVRAMIEKIKTANSATTIYWINLFTTDDSADSYIAMNSTLENLSGELGFRVIDWASVASAYYAPDNIHPNGRYGDMASFVVSQIGPPTTSGGTDTSCANGTTDLGEVDGYQSGVLTPIKVCAVPTVPSNSSESNPSNNYYIEGADGKLVVNASISGKVLDMAQLAEEDGITLIGSSGFRSKEHQEYLYNCYITRSCNNGNTAARPGTSNHQMGVAIDFDILVGENDPTLTTCRANPSAYPTYEWLAENAGQYGFSANVESECWHWSTTGN